MHDPTFLELGKVLFDLPQGTLILGGDWNAMLDRELDFSRSAGPRVYPVDVRFRNWTASLGFCDVWWTGNPQTKQFTNTSAALGTHSRIDSFFIPATEVGLAPGSPIFPLAE